MENEYYYDFLTPDEESLLITSTIKKLKRDKVVIIDINSHYHYIYYWNALLSTHKQIDMGDLLRSYGNIDNRPHVDFNKIGTCLESIIRFDPEIPHYQFTCTSDMPDNSGQTYDDFYMTWWYRNHKNRFDNQRRNSNANN